MLKHIFNNLIKAAFFNRQNYFNSWTECKSVTADTWTWHLRLEHAGAQALQHLITCSKSAQIQRKSKLKDSITINCDDCAATKISQKIHHELKFNKEDSEEHLIINFHDFNSSSEDFTFMTIIIDYWSDFIWDFYLSSHSDRLIINFLIWFFDFLKWQYKIEFKVMKMNRKLFS